MRRLRAWFSPSLAIAVAALVVAMGGTAIAAGELITRPDQVANDVIEGRHIKARAIGKADLEDVYLSVRVDSAGHLVGTGNDGTAVRENLGRYRVTFTGEASNGVASKTPIDVSNCAITATPVVTPVTEVPPMPDERPGPATLQLFRGIVPGSNVPPLGPGSVRILSTKPIYTQGQFDNIVKDTRFEVAAVC